jgi:hypothetical protein
LHPRRSIGIPLYVDRQAVQRTFMFFHMTIM